MAQIRMKQFILTFVIIIPHCVPRGQLSDWVEDQNKGLRAVVLEKQWRMENQMVTSWEMYKYQEMVSVSSCLLSCVVFYPTEDACCCLLLTVLLTVDS